MRYADIHKMNVSDGPGIGVSLYVQGCELHCLGCFNAETWSLDGGKPFLNVQLLDIIHYLEPEWMTRLSILGGEPLREENYYTLAHLARMARNAKPSLLVWLWTGRKMEDVLVEAKKNGDLALLLGRIDVVVDGPFVQDLKDISLQWRGSSNQRVLDMRETLLHNSPVELEHGKFGYEG